MPIFVHLTSHRNIRAIRRSGIGLFKRRLRPRGVYAMPVTRNFYVSHQWLRELKRFGGGSIVGVYFRVADQEVVEVGHYNSVHVAMTAAEAVGLMMRAEKRDPSSERRRDQQARAVQRGRRLPSSPEGFEVILPRRVEPTAIVRVKPLPQVVGWRYRPGAHGQPPCACCCCERGTYGLRKLLRQVEEEEVRGHPTRVILFGRRDDSFRRVDRLRRQRASGETGRRTQAGIQTARSENGRKK